MIWTKRLEYYSPTLQYIDWVVSEAASTRYNTIIREQLSPSRHYYVSTGLSQGNPYPNEKHPLFPVDFVEEPEERYTEMRGTPSPTLRHYVEHPIFCTPHTGLMVSELWDNTEWVSTAFIDRGGSILQRCSKNEGYTQEFSKQEHARLIQKLKQEADEK